MFRVIEYLGGHEGPLRIQEGYFYLLDSVPLFLAMSLYAALWPARLLGASHQHPIEQSAYGHSAYNTPAYKQTSDVEMQGQYSQPMRYDSGYSGRSYDKY